MLKKEKITKYHRHLILISLSWGLLWLGITGWRNKPEVALPPKIWGAIIPHHDVAQELMEDLGQKLTQQKVDRVVIIGPNHFGAGKKRIEKDWVEQDHACTVPRAVLRKYLMGADFSCVLVDSRATTKEMEGLVEELVKENEATVVVASVDFSHYLPKYLADINDEVTRRYVENWDKKALLKLGDHYVDSPKSIAILWDYLQRAGVKEGKIVRQTNSAEILGIPDLASTTSYFEVIYRK